MSTGSMIGINHLFKPVNPCFNKNHVDTLFLVVTGINLCSTVLGSCVEPFLRFSGTDDSPVTSTSCMKSCMKLMQEQYYDAIQEKLVCHVYQRSTFAGF